MVDEEFVRRFLRGRSVLGTRISINAMMTPPRYRGRLSVSSRRSRRGPTSRNRGRTSMPIAQNSWWNATLVVQPTDGARKG